MKIDGVPIISSSLLINVHMDRHNRSELNILFNLLPHLLENQS